MSIKQWQNGTTVNNIQHLPSKWSTTLLSKSKKRSKFYFWVLNSAVIALWPEQQMQHFTKLKLKDAIALWLLSNWDLARVATVRRRSLQTLVTRFNLVTRY